MIYLSEPGVFTSTTVSHCAYSFARFADACALIDFRSALLGRRTLALYTTSIISSRSRRNLLLLIAKLSSEERHRLRRLAFRVGITDAAAYAAQPVGSGEFENEDDALGWGADGWDDVG